MSILLTIKDSIPTYLSKSSADGMKYSKKYVDLTETYAIVGYLNARAVSGVILEQNSLIMLDDGIVLNYTQYRVKGLSALLEIPGFDLATSFQLFVNPQIREMKSVITDLMISTRPSNLCTVRVQTDTSPIFVPHYKG